MKRADLIVKGRVQRAGYRDTIDRLAYQHDLSGFVENLEDGTVKVVCEGEDDEIEKFIDDIRIDKYPIKVTDIEVKYSDPTGEFEYFDIVREEDFTKAVYERMDIAAEYLGNIYSETRKVHEETKNVGAKVDNVGAKVEEGFADVKQELGGKLDNISEKLDRSIKQTDDFHNETVEKFDYLDVKYGEFSNTLGKMLSRFDVLEDDIREIKDAFIKLVDHFTS